ncbi:hypothetical protein LVJ94_13810 [Pendulispora rubella]|uniref:Uncharacterized protein n=1 Tax=Pendulispora rubella TaxID=2741070 RepID=A0ABZ2LHP6_9BACT
MRNVFGAALPKTDAGHRGPRDLSARVRALLGTVDDEDRAELIGLELWDLSPETNPFGVEQIVLAAESLVLAVRGPEGHPIGPGSTRTRSLAAHHRAQATQVQLRELLKQLDEDERARLLAEAIENLSDDIGDYAIRSIERYAEKARHEILEPHRSHLASAWHDDDLWVD